MLRLLLIPLVLSVAAQECPIPKPVSEETHLGLVYSQLQFSVDLLQTVGQQKSPGNVFFSPSSIYNAMLITYFSTGSHTENSLKRALRMPDSQVKSDVVSEYFQSKWHSQGKINKKYELSNANRIYVSNDLQVKDCMKELFAEELQPAEFSADADGVRKQINRWVANETKNMIPELLPENYLKSDTKVVIVNAAYFKGKWMQGLGFDKRYTREDKFHKEDGSTVPVTMMYGFIKPGMITDDHLEATILELPYEGGDISMFILLPNKPSSRAISALLSRLTGPALYRIFEETGAAAGLDIDVFVPKFTVELEYDLNQILRPMGAEALFDNSADFSPLVKGGGLVISKAIHKAKVQVDEEGTEAAAATAIGAVWESAQFEKLEFRADHPFVYAIYDKPDKILLFTGIFNSP